MDFKVLRSRPATAAGAAGGGGGGGGAAGTAAAASAGTAYPISTTFDKVPMAFSRIGSTWCNIPNLLSKSCTAGIIFDKDYIFENTLTSGYESSNLLKIFFVSDF